jgi:hypothetical protein
MKTYMRIPFTKADPDPSWVIKKKLGKKLNPIEVDQYY